MRNAKQCLSNAAILSVVLMMNLPAWGQQGKLPTGKDIGADATATISTNAAVVKAQSAELELAVDAVHLAIEKAKLRMTQRRFEEAMNLAQAGLKLVNRLPTSASHGDLSEPLLQIVVDARVAQAGPCTHDRVAEKQTGSGAGLDDAPPTTNVGRPVLAPTSSDDMITHVGEDSRIVQDTVLYPADWPQRTANRKQKDEGVLFKGPAFEDDDGHVLQTVIYDVHSLIFPTPAMQDLPTMDLRAMTRHAADRAALRQTSEIFTGYASDLDAGADVLPYFGGVGTWPVVPDSSSDEQYRELVRLINLVIDQH